MNAPVVSPIPNKVEADITFTLLRCGDHQGVPFEIFRLTGNSGGKYGSIAFVEKPKTISQAVTFGQSMNGKVRRLESDGLQGRES